MSKNIYLPQILRKLRNVHRSESVSGKGRAGERGRRGVDLAEGERNTQGGGCASGPG